MSHNLCEAYYIDVLLVNKQNKVGVYKNPQSNLLSIYRLQKHPKHTVQQAVNEFLTFYKTQTQQVTLLGYYNASGKVGTQIHTVISMRVAGVNIPNVVWQDEKNIKDQEIVKWWKQYNQGKVYPLDLVLTKQSAKV